MPDLYGLLTPKGVLNGSLQTIVYANNYNGLINKPSINSVELQGNKTAADLGLLTEGDIPVESVNGKQGVVILDGDDIEYEAGTSVNSKITDLEAEIGSGPVVSVNGQQGVVELDGTDINYSLTKTLNQKIDEVAASIPIVSYPVTSVNTKTGDVVLDGDDIDYAEGVTVNEQIGTNAANIGDLSQLTTSVTSSLVGAVNEIATYTPVYGNTASGAIATFDTSLALPLQDCTIAINAVQEGTGTPSSDNVRPITGFSSVNVSVSGVNLWDEDYELGFWNANGVFLPNTSGYMSSKTHIPVKPNDSICVVIPNKISFYLCRYDKNKNFIDRLTLANPAQRVVQMTSETFYITFSTYQEYGTTYNNDISINYPSTDTDYHAYNGTTVTISLGQTVYGGSLDVTSGVLTVTHGIITFDGSGDEIWNDGTNRYSIEIADCERTAGRSEVLCNRGVYASSGDSEGTVFVTNTYFYYYQPTSITSLADFKTWLGSNNLVAVYPLATPVTYQLTPTQISAIVGTNNVFTDTNGNTSVVYACSLKDYIEGQ